MKTRLSVVMLLAIFLLGISGCSSDANEIDDMVKSLNTAKEKKLKEYNLLYAEALANSISGLTLEKEIIQTSPEQRSLKNVTTVKDLLAQEWYKQVLKENLTSSQHQRLQELRVKYGYAK